MPDGLAQAKQRLAQKVDSVDLASIEVIAADPWVISSLLQKSIRRGETAMAQRAAHSIFKLKGSTIWRRLMVIAFEDVGSGCTDALTAAVVAGTDATWRKTVGGDAAAAMYLARVLAEAPKDRSADYLICGAKDHPSLEQQRFEIATASVVERLRAVADGQIGLPHRSLAAWYASGLEWTGEKRVGKGDLSALMQVFLDLGTPSELIAATELAARRTREPITVMVPLAWLGANNGQKPTFIEIPVPPSLVVDGVPLYALDKHTRLGREAIWRFASRNEDVRAALDHYVPPARRRDAAYMAAFYTDAMPVATKLIWKGAEELETFGMETDLMTAGVPPAGFAPLLAAFRNNLGHLNEIRAECFVRQRSAVTGGLG